MGCFPSNVNTTKFSIKSDTMSSSDFENLNQKKNHITDSIVVMKNKKININKYLNESHKNLIWENVINFLEEKDQFNLFLTNRYFLELLSENSCSSNSSTSNESFIYINKDNSQNIKIITSSFTIMKCKSEKMCNQNQRKSYFTFSNM